MKLKIKWKELIICIAIPLAVGGLSALLTRNSMEQFSQLNQPPLSPPSWLFPVVWTILYTLMGIASYLVLTSEENSGQVRRALTLYGVQLAVNFVWPLLFFRLEVFLIAFGWLVLLWVLIWSTRTAFSRISKAAGYLLIPYLLWVSFAGYLNLGVAILN
ncbi:MAG: tryptophan-rich sensory protein [Anaerotignum sp.]|nr:tryptophan-rich sensory protein [Anaerotignum sp.]